MSVVESKNWFNSAQEVHTAATKIAVTLRAGDALAAKVSTDVPAAVHYPIAFTKLLTPIGLFFAIPNLIMSIQAAHYAQKLQNRIRHSVQAVFSLLTFPRALIDTLGVLEVFKVVEKLSWTPIVSIALWPFQFLGLSLGLYDLAQTIKLRQEMKRQLPVQDLTHRRINTKLTMQVLETAVKVSLIVVSGLFLFTPVTTPLVAALLVISIASLALYGGEKLQQILNRGASHANRTN